LGKYTRKKEILRLYNSGRSEKIEDELLEEEYISDIILISLHWPRGARTVSRDETSFCPAAIIILLKLLDRRLIMVSITSRPSRAR